MNPSYATQPTDADALTEPSKECALEIVYSLFATLHHVTATFKKIKLIWRKNLHRAVIKQCPENFSPQNSA